MSTFVPSLPQSERDRGLTVARQWVVVATIVGLFALAAALNADRRDIARGFDELAQTSYVAHLQRTGEIWPTLETTRLLDPSDFQFTDRPNYLNHPPFYYWLLARLGPQIEGRPRALLMDRLLNIVLVVSGLAALMVIGILAWPQQFKFYAYCNPLASIPVLPQLAGAVNADNLAFAGGAIATLATWQMVATGNRIWLLIALAAVVVAAWTKLTGLLLVGGMVSGVVAWLMLRRQLSHAYGVVLAAVLLIAAAPYFVFIAEYGSPVPNTPAQVALLESGAHTAGWDHATRMAPPAYVVYFLSNFVAGWMPTLAARNSLNYAMLVLPVAAALCALAGIVFSISCLRRNNEGPIDVVVVAGALAFMATLLIHICYSYNRHLMTGWLLDAYPRYYLPLAALLPLAGLSLLAAIDRPRVRAALTAFLIAGPLVFAIFGAPLG